MISVSRAKSSFSKGCNPGFILLVFFLYLIPHFAQAQHKVVVIQRDSTPEGLIRAQADLIRARADASLILKQAQLVGEKAIAQRLDNMIKECDVAYKRFASRSQIKKEALANEYEHKFDVIRFKRELEEIRSELERNRVTQHTGIGDLTDEMNFLLEKYFQNSFDMDQIPSLKTELSEEQLDAIYLTDSSIAFSAKTGRTRLEMFEWPFFLQKKEFQEEREHFDALCGQALKEINTNGAPTPETTIDLLSTVETISKKLNTMPLSDNLERRGIEAKWQNEATAFVQKLLRTLGDFSKLDAARLSKYVFQGNTLGELVEHMKLKGLRFSRPNEQDSNLYASIFFIMRHAYQEHEKSLKNTTSQTASVSSEIIPKGQATKGNAEPPHQKPDKIQNPRSNREKVTRHVTLVIPYPESYPGAPTDKITLQYAVIELSKQAGLSYDWNQSFQNTNPICRRWVFPDIRQMPFKNAMESILMPQGLTYVIKDGKVVLLKMF